MDDRLVKLKKPKNLLDLPIEVMPTPARVFIPLQQHKGLPAIPVVKKGETVKIGSKIGEANGSVSANIHASVSGRVVDIKLHPHPNLRESWCCIIETDYANNLSQEFSDFDFYSLRPEELLNKIEEAGIVGLGGGGYPTAQKLRAAMTRELNLLLINGCESEPNLTADYRIMLEYPEKVIEGAKIIQKILDVPKMIFVFTKRYQKAAELFKKKGVQVMVFADSYPLGAERLLLKEFTKIVLPYDKLPIDAGVVVHNVNTCYAIYQAIKSGKPLIERVVTISGDAINKPKNLLVKIGTPVREIIQYCGGLRRNLKKIIFGGVMTGNAQFSLDTPVIKTTPGIVFQDTIMNEETRDCVQCGKCIDVCPVGIFPAMIYRTIRRGQFEEAPKYGLNECLECGSCAYICPAFIPLVHYFKYARLRNVAG